jgi:type IV pilus assembly protein PilW
MNPQFRSHTRMAGLSLIELMISMVIGLVVVGALVALYSGTTGTTSVAKAQNEMNEDAQYVLRILSNQIHQAGFNPIQANRTTVNPLTGGLPIFACSNGFSNPTTAADASALTCNSSAVNGGHGLTLTYEADIRNTKPTGGGLPTNCLGDALVQQSVVESGTTYNYYVAENRFYVKNNKLYCAGTEATIQEQPLADNVERIEVSLGTAYPADLIVSRTANDDTAPTDAEMLALVGRTPKTGDIAMVRYNTAATAATKNYLYGVVAWAVTSYGTSFAAGYLTPDNIGPASGIVVTGVNANLVALTPAQRWGKVVTVRLCVVMRSEKEVLPESTSYYGCDVSGAAVTTSTDRYLRRAYVTTIALRNRMGLPS